MKDWSEVKDGDILRVVDSKDDENTITVKVYRGEKYLAGTRDMWPVSEFDPKDWEIVKGK